MKWINGRTQFGRDSYCENWHKWFAWYPVKVGVIGNGENQRYIRIWLEYVERNGVPGYRKHRVISEGRNKDEED